MVGFTPFSSSCLVSLPSTSTHLCFISNLDPFIPVSVQFPIIYCMPGLALIFALNFLFSTQFLVPWSSLFQGSTTRTPKEYFLMSVLAYWTIMLFGSTACLVLGLSGWSVFFNKFSPPAMLPPMSSIRWGFSYRQKSRNTEKIATAELRLRTPKKVARAHLCEILKFNADDPAGWCFLWFFKAVDWDNWTLYIIFFFFIESVVQLWNCFPLVQKDVNRNGVRLFCSTGIFKLVISRLIHALRSSWHQTFFVLPRCFSIYHTDFL